MKSKNGNPLSNDKNVDFNTPLRPLQNRYTPTGTLFRWGMAVAHIAVINLWPFHFRNGYDIAVSEVKLPVSEVKPPPESRSGQKSPLEVQKSCG